MHKPTTNDTSNKSEGRALKRCYVTAFFLLAFFAMAAWLSLYLLISEQKSAAAFWTLTLMLLASGALLIFYPVTKHLGAIIERLQSLTEKSRSHKIQCAEKLRQDKAYTEMLLNSVAEGIYGVDMQGTCTFINAPGLRMLGYQSESELVGKSIHPLIHHTRPDGSHYPCEECPLSACLRSHEDIHVDEELFWRKDGSSFSVDYWSRSTLLNGEYGGVVTFIDISERKRFEENLLITASVFGNSQEAIVITDADNAIVDVNPAFTLLTGYSREEVLGENPRLLSSGRQDKAFYANMWRALKQTRCWRGEIWNRRKSGEIYAELLSISAICDSEGRAIRHVAVFSDISYIKKHENELDHIAHYDQLTGIPNRLLLADRMKQAIAQTAREKNLMAICYLDLDGFKPVNDELGHEAGDAVLVEIAKRIGNTIRGGDTVARLGGDEFVALLLGQEKCEESIATVGRILSAIAEPIIIKNHPVSVSASIGVSIYPLDEEAPDTLLRHADQAMYIAKQSGKNRFHIYDTAQDQQPPTLAHAEIADVKSDQTDSAHYPAGTLVTYPLITD